jgi:hypothetical protein
MCTYFLFKEKTLNVDCIERLGTDVHVMCIYRIQIQVYVLKISEFDSNYQYFDTVRLRR